MTVTGVYDTIRRLISIDNVKGPDGDEILIETREEEEALVEASFLAANQALDQEVEIATTGGN